MERFHGIGQCCNSACQFSGKKNYNQDRQRKGNDNCEQQGLDQYLSIILNIAFRNFCNMKPAVGQRSAVIVSLVVLKKRICIGKQHVFDRIGNPGSIQA